MFALQSWTGPAHELFLQSSSVLASVSRGPSWGVCSRVCAGLFFVMDTIAEFLLEPCKYLWRAFGYWVAQLLHESSANPINSVLLPGIFLVCFDTYCDCRVDRCLGLGSNSILLALGTWPAGSFKTKRQNKHSICFRTLWEGMGEENGWLPEYSFEKGNCFLCSLGDRLTFNVFVEQVILEVLWWSG